MAGNFVNFILRSIGASRKSRVASMPTSQHSYKKIVPQNGNLSDESPDKRPKRSSKGTKCFSSYAATPFLFSSTNFM